MLSVSIDPLPAAGFTGKELDTLREHFNLLSSNAFSFEQERTVAVDIEKLKLVRSISQLLSEFELGDVNLLLHSVDLDDLPWNEWHDDQWEPTQSDRMARVLSQIRDLPKAVVQDLATAVESVFEVNIAKQDLETVAPLLLFASHRDTQSGFVGEVANQLQRFGITLFVAHKSIEPDDEWHRAIEESLKNCHGGVVFLSDGFIESQWCDQEVGWLLGRDVPTYALKFEHNHPYGPLGKKQAFTVRQGMTAAELAKELVHWVSSKPGLGRYLEASLAQALIGSRSFAHTDELWALLKDARHLDGQGVAAILSAMRDNNQVYLANGLSSDGEGRPYPHLLFELSQAQPGFEENLELAAEVARIRELPYLVGGGTSSSFDPGSVPF